MLKKCNTINNILSKLKTLLIYLLKYLMVVIKIYKKRTLKYPNTIQLPITYKCNCDCVMCGMHHMIQKEDFSPEDLKIILSDRLFKRVKSVGINGGEPFLRKDIDLCIRYIIETLPSLKSINIISNGYFCSEILEKLKLIRETCKKNAVTVNVSISVDAIDELEDFHRGHKDAFKNADKTIKKILEEKDKYVDNLDVICTITKYNIYNINEVEAWAQNLGISVAYNIASINVRIENQKKDFLIFSDERGLMLAREFFYSKFRENNSMRYYGIFLYLLNRKRYDICPCMYNEWITLTPDSQIGFCATRSKNLGSSLEKSSFCIVKDNKKYLKELRSQYCEECSHYIYSLNPKGYKLYLKELYKNKYFV